MKILNFQYFEMFALCSIFEFVKSKERRHPHLGEVMVSASVSTGSSVTQKPDSLVAVLTAVGTGVVCGPPN